MNTSIRLIAVALTITLAGCQALSGRRPVPIPEPPPPPPVIQAPLATHTFQFDPATSDVVGELQLTVVEGEDTFSDIARRFNLGYEEMVRANPGVDPWLPGEGRKVVLPTQFVLPDAPREGLVINLAQLRVFYFSKRKEGELQTVTTHPIGIGKVGWSTPEGTTKITGKSKNPTWFPPASVRKEHREAGDPLPSKVPPGPDNPLGTHMMTLGWPSYLVHGTNKPYGVGMRSSHGCMRFYPEDIAELYDDIPVGTKVTVVNQPFVFGWSNGAVYAQAFPVLEDDERDHPKSAAELLSATMSDRIWQSAKQHNVGVDQLLINTLVTQRRGIAVPVSQQALTMDKYLANSRHVENELPAGATWNGKEELLVSAEEFEAARSGAILPKAEPKKAGPKAAAAKTTSKPAPAKTVANKTTSTNATAPAKSAAQPLTKPAAKPAAAVVFDVEKPSSAKPAVTKTPAPAAAKTSTPSKAPATASTQPQPPLINASAKGLR